MKKQTIFILFIIGAALLIGLWRQPNNALTMAAGTAVAHSNPLPPFSLIDMNGKAFTQDSLKNRWSFLFFGYSHCPELCPTTLDAMKNISQRLRRGAIPQFIFVSIDPEQDTPARLKDFLQQERFKHSSIIGVTGDKAAIHALASTIGLHASQETKNVEHIEHSGAIVLINPQGQLAAVFSSTEKPGAIAHDFKSVAHRYVQRV